MIVGLGNPGRTYAATRHNVGFRALDQYVEDMMRGHWKQWHETAMVSEINGARPVRCVKPLTYMNNSGQPVREIADYYRIAPESILVVFDDFALPLGMLRLRASGSAGGHNGISSVIDHMGTAMIPRLRLGVGPLPSGVASADFVLSSFSSDEKPAVETMITDAVRVINEVVSAGLALSISRMTLLAAQHVKEKPQ